MTRLTFTIPADLWMSSNRNIPNHGYRRRLISDIHELVGDALGFGDPAPIVGPVHVDWTIRYPKGVRRDKGDPTNAHPTTKAVLDACVHWGLIEDDGPQHVIAETFRRGPNLDRAGDHEIQLVLIAQDVPW